MSTQRRAAILKLASTAYEMDLRVVNGELKRDENGRLQINSLTSEALSLEQLFAEYEGQELVLVIGSLADNRPVPTRICRTCGRDYTDLECPHCRSNRIRLRGR